MVSKCNLCFRCFKTLSLLVSKSLGVVWLIQGLQVITRFSCYCLACDYIIKCRICAEQRRSRQQRFPRWVTRIMEKSAGWSRSKKIKKRETLILKNGNVFFWRENRIMFKWPISLLTFTLQGQEVPDCTHLSHFGMYNEILSKSKWDLL